MEEDFHARSAKFIIERFDKYNDSVNNKGALYLSVNTFILGGICVGYCSFYKDCHPDGQLFGWLLAAVALLLACCLASILYTILAIDPYLKDNLVNDDKPSLLFFGGISKLTCNEFSGRFLKRTVEEAKEDSIRQAHSLAFGLNKKYRNLKIASRFLIAEYTLLIATLLLTYFNSKP